MLVNLFKTYEVVKPKQTLETPKVPEYQPNRYHRLIQFIQSKQESQKDTIQEEPTQQTKKEEEKTPTVTVQPQEQNFVYNNGDDWANDLINAYRKAGLNDNAIKNLLAKNALESGWGKYTQGNYNFGNITTGSSWKGNYVQGSDHDSKGNKISQKFRSYNSIDEYVEDEIQFLTRLYDFNQNDDFDTFIGKLQGNNSGKRRYAEDKQYSTKVKQVYNSI